MARRDGSRGLSPDAIRAAHHSVPPEFRDTPQFVADALAELAGGPVVVKIETLNPIRSFKGRGTSLAVPGLVRGRSASASRGIATVSTGNFGQGVAYAARSHGVPAAVVVPEGANPLKVAAIERLGARVVEVPAGPGAAAAAEDALDRLVAEGYLILRDGHDDRLAIGAGTLALEVTDGIGARGLPPIEVAFVPVGDGSLIAGVGTWLRSASPATRIIGVQVQSAPAMAMSWRSGRTEVVPPEPSRADGLATGTGNADLLPTLRTVVDDMILVPEEALLPAQRELHATLGVTAEASAAAGWSAAKSAAGSGARLVIVTGSNSWPGDFGDAEAAT
jgi:threonine dehydratase